MQKTQRPFVADLIPQFTPLNNVASKYHFELSNGMKVESVAAGKTITRKAPGQTKNHTLLHYLVAGSVEVRESFNKRHQITAGQDNTRPSLESRLPDSGNIKALEGCQVLVVDNVLLEQLLALDHDYKVYYLDEGEFSMSDDALIDDDFQEDWDDVFIRSHLASNLPNPVIHQLFSQLEDIAVSAGDTVVKTKTPGDYFYIVKKGTAMVATEDNGPFKGMTFPLDTGQYFGDEALVAGTLRNADVVMATDGVLGRLDAEAFEQLVKPHLIPHLHEQDQTADAAAKLLDVRFAAEFQQGHTEGSQNIPICYLRQKLTSLQPAQRYVIAPANDRRAELATYIMRQAGFQAYHQTEQAVAD